MLPIQSGYRFVLTYNLVNTALERHLSASVLDTEQSKIGRMLDEWYPMRDRQTFMCYVLQHKYTDANLRLRNLKGDDYYRCYQLHGACRTDGRFCIFLSRLELTVTRTNDEEYEEKAEEKLYLDGVFALQGIKLRDSLVISEDCVVQRNVHESREHDEQWGGEHMGNQYADIQQVYRDTVRVVPS